MTKIEAAKAQFQEIVRDLEAVKYRLIGVHTSLPLAPSEKDPLREVDPTDPIVRLHGAIDSVLSDDLEPLIESLRDIAGLGRQ